ncbi:MAG: hypothetical protein KJ600_04600 [Nanoarchaeota archaeon]|nr:hypothetical protein [Nanoarchaeota archaeon]MBU1103808.1 hypothetical protein [Nanoarchaeota archaeon]
MDKKNAQVWIETVMYTLIGLALIGIVLAIATPRINEAKDRIAVEQTIESLNVWDEKISEVLDRGPGNNRNIPSFVMKRGELFINGDTDTIVFILDELGKPYSEPDIEIEFGEVVLVSRQEGKSNSVEMTLNYLNVTNLTYDGEDNVKKFTAAATPYAFSIKNLGGVNISNVDIEESSR